MKAHVVVESVGPATWDRSVRALLPGGRLVVCGGTSGQSVEVSLPRLFFKQYELIGSTMGSYGEFAVGHELMAQGLPVSVDGVFGLDEYPAALAPARVRRPARQARPAPRVAFDPWPARRSSRASRTGFDRPWRPGPRPDRRLPPDPRPPELNYRSASPTTSLPTGILRRRGARGGAVGLRPRHRLHRPGRHRAAPRSRCSASTTPSRHRPRLRAQHHRHGRPRGRAGRCVARRGAGRASGRDGHPRRGGGGGEDPRWPRRARSRASTPPSWCTRRASTSPAWT